MVTGRPDNVATPEHQETRGEQSPHPHLIGLLKGVSFFAVLDDHTLEQVARIAQRLTYAPGEMIFLEGEPCAGLYMLERGRCKIFKISTEGREQTLQVVLPGNFFNHVAALDGGPNAANAVALDNLTAWVMARADIKTLAFQYPALSWVLLEHIAHVARFLIGIVEDLGLRPVKARLAKLLLEEAERSQQGELDRESLLTQQEIAARLGTVREMVGRALRTLMDDGAIKMERHRIVIVDREALKQMAML